MKKVLKKLACLTLTTAIVTGLNPVSVNASSIRPVMHTSNSALSVERSLAASPAVMSGVTTATGADSVQTFTYNTVSVQNSTYSKVTAGFAETDVNPGILSYNEENATKDWVQGDKYYYLENNFAKYVIGTTNYPQTSNYTVTGIGKQGALVEGTMVDAFSKATRRENLDYSELVLVKSDFTDLRNWYYYQYKLRQPDITADAETGSITAKGDWDYDSGIESSVVYSMLDESPVLKMDITLRNNKSTAFSGKIGYIIDANEGTSNALDRATYIPGIGWKDTDATSGTQLTSGWTEGYVYIGQKGTYTGNTGHAVIWNEETQPAAAVIPKYSYTGSWFNVNLDANGGTQTITIYHLAEVPPDKDEPFAAASLWAKAIKEGNENGYAVVTGVVTDKAGNRIAGATVKATDGTNTYKATTNSQGFYYMWTAKGSNCWITASYQDLAEAQKQLVLSDVPVTYDFVLGPTAVGQMPAGKDPGFSGYEGYCRDWDTNTPYYYIKNRLASYLIGTKDTMKDGVTASQWQAQYYPITGQNVWGSLTKGSIMDAVPAFTGYENLDWTEFIISSSVNGRWFYPNGTPNQGMLRLNNIQVNDADGKITASGYWDGNEKNGKNLKASVDYSLVENSPLVKMDITITNEDVNPYNGYFGYYFDKEGSGEEYTYIPGAGWFAYNSSNVHITSGWNQNYLFSGRKTGYTGKTAHAVIWLDGQEPYGMINNGGHTGVDYSLNLNAGESKVITLYHMAHVPGAESEPYASAALWAEAVKSKKLDQISTVNGSVSDLITGTGIDGAVISYAFDNRIFTAVTNSSGNYQLFVPKDKQYSVSASKTGYTMEQTYNNVNEYIANHAIIMQSSNNSLEVELYDSNTALASVSGIKPSFDYSNENCDTWETGDLLLTDKETSVLIDKATGVIKDIVPNSAAKENIGYSELVLTGTPDFLSSHAGKNFDMSSVNAEGNKVIATGISQADNSVSASVYYSAVENSPLVKVKISLKNNGLSKYSGSLGYVFDTVGNGEQTYIPGSGWIGGGPGEYAKALKAPLQNENYIYNGSFGKETNGSSHSVIWSDYFKPSNLIWSGDWVGAWFDVSLDANGRKDIIFYHLADTPGDLTNPLDPVKFWANVVKYGTDPLTVSRIKGSASKDGIPSKGIKITACFDNQSYTTTTLDDGTYTIYAINGKAYTLTASNGTYTTDGQTANLVEGGCTVDFEIAGLNKTSKAGMTYGDPGYVYNPGQGLRDWWPIYPYYYLENDFTKVSIDTRRASKLTPARPSEDSTVWSNSNSGNNVWGGVNSGTIIDAVSKQSMTENLDWSSFVLFPQRPSDPSDPDYFNRNYLGVTDNDEAVPNEMYMEWSWWFPMNKLELNNITSDGESVTAAGAWEGGIDQRKDILSSVKYSLVENSPLVKMDITLTNTGSSVFDGQFAYLLDPDMEGEQHSYIPGFGWEYSQVKKRITEGWADNYIFDGYNGYSGNTAHAIIWPDDQQPILAFGEAGWISAWFKTNIPAGESDTLTIYYMPHTPGSSEAPYSNAEYWSRFIKQNGIAANQASIRGRVTDKSGNGISDVKMSLENSKGTHMQVITDANGNYTLYAQAGSYTLRAYSPEYSLITRTYDLAGGDLIVEDIELIKYTDAEAIFPESISRGSTFDFTVTVRNESGIKLDQVDMEIITPAAVKLISDSKIKINNLEANEERSFTLKALAVYGGRESIRVRLSNPEFNMTKSFTTDIFGYGWFGGDNHTHTKNSDGVNTVKENVKSAYERWKLSWIWNTDHNTDTQKPEADAETELYNGRFKSISATEITTGYSYKPSTPSGQMRGHALVYGFNGVPALVIDPKGGAHDWQASINEITAAGALFYIAHPFDSSYSFEDVYDWQGYTGIEVWNGSVHASHKASQKAFKLWDQVNIRGERHYYGIAGTDGHNSKKVGDLGIKGIMNGLSTDNVFDLTKNGKFYGTNGPDLRFTVNGADMGSTVTLAKPGTVTIKLEAASDDGNLTSVRILGYPVTGNIDDYDAARTVVFEKDLTLDNTNYYSGTVNVDIDNKMFFRLEVKSESCNPGSTGNGPETGTGFAFSNPVWVEIGEADTSRIINSIKMSGVTLEIEQDGFGRQIVTSGTNVFDLNNLSVDAGLAETNCSYTPINTGNMLGLLNIVVKAGGYDTVYSYIVMYKPSDNAPTDPETEEPSPEEPQEYEKPDTSTEPSKPEVPGESSKPQKPVESEKAKSFDDISEQHWAFEYISYLSEKGILQGKGEKLFDPEGFITRAEFVTIIARMAKADITGMMSEFEDVDKDSWYSPYIAWAKKSGITNGVDETHFAPNQPVSREDIAVMIYRYAQYINYILPEISNKTGFTDNEEISGYARNAINLMQQASLISGHDTGAFGPKENATRAQTAKIIALLLKGMEAGRL